VFSGAYKLDDVLRLDRSGHGHERRTVVAADEDDGGDLTGEAV
jgi:hypothetical protein